MTSPRSFSVTPMPLGRQGQRTLRRLIRYMGTPTFHMVHPLGYGPVFTTMARRRSICAKVVHGWLDSARTAGPDLSVNIDTPKTSVVVPTIVQKPASSQIRLCVLGGVSARPNTGLCLPCGGRRL